MSDLFISYVSRDKNMAHILIEALEQKGLTIDQVRFGIGDSLGVSMRKGFQNARFGILILSPNFFRMPWPRSDLDEVAQIDRNYQNAQTRLLPVWYNIAQQEIADFSTALAQRIGAQFDSTDDLEFVVDDLLSTIEPDSSIQTQPTSKSAMFETSYDASHEPNLILLRDQMSTHFNTNELQSLCFELDIDFDNLAGGTKDGKIRELIGYMQRRRQLDQLIKALARQRPQVRWG